MIQSISLVLNDSVLSQVLSEKVLFGVLGDRVFLRFLGLWVLSRLLSPLFLVFLASFLTILNYMKLDFCVKEGISPDCKMIFSEFAFLTI